MSEGEFLEEYDEEFWEEERREVARAAAGDQRSLAHLLIRYAPLIKGAVRSRRFAFLGEDAQQVAQIYFMDAVETYDAARGHFAPYARLRVYGGLSDFARAELRRRSREVHIEEKPGEADPWERIYLAAGEAHEDEYSRVELKEALGRAMMELDERERHVIAEIFFRDRKARDVAEELGISPQLISHIKSRALKKLRAALKIE